MSKPFECACCFYDPLLSPLSRFLITGLHRAYSIHIHFISYSYFLFLSILQDDEDSYEEIIRTNTGDSLFKVKRNSEVLGSLTRDRAPPPKNRRRPSLKKRHETSEIFTNSEEELDEVSYILTNLAPQ